MKTELFTRRARDAKPKRRRRDEPEEEDRARGGRRARARRSDVDEDDDEDRPAGRGRARRGGRSVEREEVRGEAPQLRAIASPVIASVLSFRALPKAERPTYSSFRREVADLLDDFQRRSRRFDLDPDDDAYFALVALADETAMSVEWDGEAEWEKNPLQVELFGKFDAGEKFFTRLRRAMEDDEPSVLEVYFNALCAGFQGNQRSDQAALASTRGRIMQRLNFLDLRDETFLTPDAYGRELERPLLTRRFPVMIALPFLIGAIGLYAAYYITLDRQVEEIRSSVEVTKSAADE